MKPSKRLEIPLLTDEVRFTNLITATHRRQETIKRRTIARLDYEQDIRIIRTERRQKKKKKSTRKKKT